MYKFLFEILNLNKSLKKFLTINFDIFLYLLSCLFAELIVNLGQGPFARALVLYTILTTSLSITTLFAFNFYNILSRHFSIRNVSFLVGIILLNILLLIVLHRLIIFYFPEIATQIRYLNINFIILQNIIVIILILSSRIVFLNFLNLTFRKNNTYKTAVIFGSDIDEIEISKNINLNSKYKVLGFLENDLNKIGRQIDDLKIYSFNDIKTISKKIQISNCIILKKKHDSNTLKNLEFLLKKQRIKSIYLENQNLSDESSFLNFKVQSLKNFNAKFFDKKTIMVTGAAGTIGKEICLQLEKTKAKKIIGVDINEYAISVFNLQVKKNSKSKIKLILTDVSNFSAVEEIVKNNKPSVIFHAAANKHVDIVENNKNYSIYNNLKSTYNILVLSAKHMFIKRLIFISTDKAVEPTNLMGFSKRTGEILINYFAKKYKKNFTSVRFGNVIGSSGSFIEILKKQIFEGGPITITDIKATRYFMTLNDAVNLVLQTCNEKFQGGVFVLKMGYPINIFNLTKKILKINNLSIKDNQNPSGDIEIKLIGLKKGEKLHEKLYNPRCKVLKTKNKLIDYEYPENIDKNKIKRILSYCNSGKDIINFKNGDKIIKI